MALSALVCLEWVLSGWDRAYLQCAEWIARIDRFEDKDDEEGEEEIFPEAPYLV